MYTHGLNLTIFKKSVKSVYANIKYFSYVLKKCSNKIYSDNFHLKKGIEWLKSAQLATNDGGVSGAYSLLFGWQPSYPETSGYIIPTLLDYYHLSNDKSILNIIEEIANWECSIQLKSGGFQSGIVGKSRMPTIFNTGQVLLGMLRAYHELKVKKYLDCAIKAGDFLTRVQETNGNWKKYCFNGISHTYNVRTAWALLELFLITNQTKYQKVAKKNLNWSLTKINKNFWFQNNSFKSGSNPFLHNICYAIRGFLESGIILKENQFIDIAYNSSLKILKFFKINRYLPATFDSNWKSSDFYSCLPGNAQLSIIWSKLYRIYQNNELLENIIKLNKYLKAKQVILNNCKEINGAISGSHPIWGKYLIFSFPNWGTKFFCDAIMQEIKLI